MIEFADHCMRARGAPPEGAWRAVAIIRTRSHVTDRPTLTLGDSHVTASAAQPAGGACSHVQLACHY